MKIKSITDVITNSSSEVFVIHYKKKEQRKDIIKILTDLFKSLGLEITDYLDWYTETKDQGKDKIYEMKTRKGDLIIYNDEGSTLRYSYIPYCISRFIEEFDSVDNSISDIRKTRG